MSGRAGLVRRVAAVTLGVTLGGLGCPRAGEHAATRAAGGVPERRAALPPASAEPIEPIEPIEPVEPLAGDAPARQEPWVVGSRSRARARLVRRPRHDGDPGATRVELEPLAPAAGPALQLVQPGVWRCLGHVAASGVYLFAGAFQRGAWLPVVTLAYLDEEDGAWRRSRATGPSWVALSAVAAPGGRFFAFVASPGGAGFELEVLDPLLDALVRAGAAPAPPPLADPAACSDERSFTWGDLIDGFVPMDTGVIELDARTLRVRYGDDDCWRRASARRERRVDLLELFTRRARPMPGE